MIALPAVDERDEDAEAEEGGGDSCDSGFCVTSESQSSSFMISPRAAR